MPLDYSEEKVNAVTGGKNLVCVTCECKFKTAHLQRVRSSKQPNSMLPASYIIRALIETDDKVFL